VEPHGQEPVAPMLRRNPPKLQSSFPPSVAGYCGGRAPRLRRRVKDEKATREAFHQGWYTGLKDIAFALKNQQDHGLDYYWVTRESTLLIRGGANYAYDQINAELTNFIAHHYQLPVDSFDIAVVGLKVNSEHEDSCCVTIELRDRQAQKKVAEIRKTFQDMAAQHVSKGARPDYIRFAQIPRNFKGAVLIKELAAEFSEWLNLHSGP